MRNLLDEIMEMDSMNETSHKPGCKCFQCTKAKGMSNSRSCGCKKCQKVQMHDGPISRYHSMLDEILFELDSNQLASAVDFNNRKSVDVGWGNYLVGILDLLRLTWVHNDFAFAEAVADWQKRNGLLADGKLGITTWDQMKKILDSSSNSTYPIAPTTSNSSKDKVFFPTGEFLLTTTREIGQGQEHWDILGSGNPLLNTGGANMEKFLSKNFQVKEFTKGRDVARIDVKLVEAVQKLRSALGKPINITSGYRSYGYNKRIYEERGKTPTKSQHISGRAVDCNVSGLNGLQLAKEAIKACGCDIAIGLGSNFIHLDVRGKYTPAYKFTVWDYGNGGLDHWVKELKQFQRSICP